MNLLLRPIFESAAERPVLDFLRQRRRKRPGWIDDDDELMVVIVAIAERER